MNGLHNQFAGFELPQEVQDAYKMGIGTQMFGSKKMAKLGFFLAENKDINFNEIYNYYISLKPQRLENESDAELKNRSNFQRVIEKYKPYFFDYRLYPNVKKQKSAKKLLKKLAKQ